MHGKVYSQQGLQYAKSDLRLWAARPQTSGNNPNIHPKYTGHIGDTFSINGESAIENL